MEIRKEAQELIDIPLLKHLSKNEIKSLPKSYHAYRLEKIVNNKKFPQSTPYFRIY